MFKISLGSLGEIRSGATAANQEKEQQLEHNEGSELEEHDNSIENPYAEKDNIPLSQCNDKEGNTLDDH